MNENKINWQLWLGLAAIGGFIVTLLKYFDDKDFRREERQNKKQEKELKAIQIELAKHELVNKTGKTIPKENTSSFMDEFFPE